MGKAADKVMCVVVVFAIIVFAIILTEHNNCRDDGGTLVRGVWWFECIKP